MEGLFNFILGKPVPKADKKAASTKQKKSSQKRKTVVLDSLEDATNLVSLMDYDLRNRRVGAYLLRKNETYQFVFGFSTEGIHPTLTKQQVETVFNKIESGLKDFPLEESMQIHYEDFRDIGERYQELEKVWEECDNETIQLIIKSQQARDKELVKQGKRREKRITLYCTYTVNESVMNATHDNWIEKSMAFVMSFYEKLMGNEKKVQHQKFERLALNAFLDGYLRWENFLSTTLGLEIKPLKHGQLWNNIWKRFNRSKPIPPPQVIVVTKKGIKEQIQSMTHPTTLLVAEREPVADDLWVNLKNRYIAPLVLVEKPGGWPNKMSQLRYIWDTVLCKERLYDIEVFAEISRANETLVQESVRRLLAQSLTSSELASEAGTIDVAAQIKTEKAVKAQSAILEGSIPFWLGFTILVHRQNLDDLDEACKYIESCFLRPAWVERERFISWKIWLQTLPITFEGLLTKPTNRRHLFLHSEVIGLLPLVKPQTCDKQGIQLITDEGAYPLFIDLFSEPKHMLVLATTRGGKSLMITFFFIYFVAKSMGVTILDYPRMDGTSTFTDLTHLVGGSYVNIVKESLNCMELPDLSHLDDEKVAEFMNIFKSFIKNFYFVVVMGTNSQNHTTPVGTQVRSIIDIAVDNFFNDPSIQERYERGRTDPDVIPTGLDFEPYTRPENLHLEQMGDTKEAFALIELRLRQFFNSTVGKAVTNKSTVKKGNLLTVYAFTNVNSDEDAAILAMIALTEALRNSLKYPRSIFFIDEAPILFEFPVISEMIGRLCANGAKAGISVIISAQDPNTIVNSKGGSKITQNLSVTLIGRIKEVAVQSFVKYLQYDEQVISRNATKSFFPKKSEIYSQWLLDYLGTKTYCRFYPGILQLALVANNPDEQRLRDEIFQSEPDKYMAYKKLCDAYVKKMRG